MSYDISNRVFASRAAADARARNEMADAERGEFLLALDDSDQITVSDWEADFLQRFMNQPKGSAMRFTPKQRDAIDRMITKYGRHV